MQQLELGDTGRDVVVWQRFLASIWIAAPEEMMHGVFDEATDVATREFQLANGLYDTGIVDRLTCEAAEARGLATVDTAVSWQPSRGTVVWFALLFCLTSWTIVSLLQAQPFILASGGKVALPMSPMWFPNAPPIKRCPDLFC
ncbi:MAG: peptidoglycan-binding domain-containing protein [Alphaproteobacteria bacterium]|nr:peptidoglycan-binding domain-containing protein [Alphaproteobacteria bacterium]